MTPVDVLAEGRKGEKCKIKYTRWNWLDAK